MNSFKTLTAVAAIIGLCSSCDRNDLSPISNGNDEISFTLGNDGIDFSADTKATAVTSLSKVYWEARNSSSVVHSVDSYPVSWSESTGTVKTGLFWPDQEATYDYYASNVSFATSTGVITVADNSTDIVAGTATGITKSASASIVLQHIFARSGSLSLDVEDKTYTLSDVSWKIKSNGADSGTAGSYTIGTGWGTSASTSLPEQSFTSDSDLYVIPASYTISVTFTLTKGSYVKTFTKETPLSFTGGKINNISGTVSSKVGDAKEIEFSISVAEWGSVNVNATFE